MNRLPPIRPQPLIAVADVAAASGWYQRILGASSGHGGDEYERLMVDGTLVLQLHSADVHHHHGAFRDPGHPPGNGVALWFEVDDFDGLVARTREAAAHIEVDVHVNPNANHREIWLRDLDGYLVVFAEP
jgi:catechol 2,3-dioxygenase-like lactoylglutathione lyase family enzyme